MIIVKLIGGLGNQLFQYAAGRRLAQVHQVPLKLDITGFETYKLHKYSLQHFNIIEEFAGAGELAGFKYRPSLPGKVAGFLFRQFGPSRKITLVKEKYFYFDPQILGGGANAYLEGYWQSEKYFKDVETVIRHDFSFKQGLDAANQDAVRQITGCNAVSVHIRRGDYVSNPATNSAHGTASMDYYRAAMKLVAEKNPDARFFVFTDDPDWVGKNMSFAYPVTLLTHNNADKNYEDLRLMSLCRHNIVANSSFSWWGAWLNANTEKIVIGPKKWFNDAALDTKDLVPDGWLRL